MSETSEAPLMIMHDFENLAVGSAHESWPLHFTVVPFFTLESVPEEAVVDLICDITESRGPLKLHLGERALFGPNEDVEVTTIYDSEGDLLELHTELIQALGDAGCRLLDESYVLDRYVPHISHKASGTMPSDEFLIKTLSIVKKLPKSVHKNKLIIDQADLILIP